MNEARSLADLLAEIGELKDTVARLRCALQPFADMASVYTRHQAGHRLLSAYGGKEILVEDLRLAADLLRE